jgi:LacI family transcriptional regulator
MVAHRIPVLPGAIVEARAYDRSEGERATLALIGAVPQITAIAASNDLLALGAYAALRSLGKACPRDIAIVGHNDMPLVDMVDPPLTTVRIGPRDMGCEAARLLLERMGGAGGPVRRVALEPQLIVRASTAPPRKGG